MVDRSAPVKYRLTGRQREYIQLSAAGKSMGEIARECGVCYWTVKNAAYEARRRSGYDGTHLGFVIWCLQQRLIDFPEEAV